MSEAHVGIVLATKVYSKHLLANQKHRSASGLSGEIVADTLQMAFPHPALSPPDLGQNSQPDVPHPEAHLSKSLFIHYLFL